MTADPEPEPSPPPELPRGVRSLILTGAVVTTTAGVLGTAFLPYLAVEQPLLLLVSSADARNLVLVAPRVDWPSAALITIPRRVIAMAVTYGLGLLYGRALLAWSAKRFPRLARLVDRLERLFLRLDKLLLVVWPTYFTSALAGVTRMTFRPYLACVVAGQTGYFFLTFYLGDLAAVWTDQLIEFLRAHLWESTAVCATAVAVQQAHSYARRRRKAREAIATTGPE